MPAPVYFLSYSRKDLQEVFVLGAVLRMHGIRTWQDLSELGLGLSEERVRSAIANETSGAVFYSTPQSVQSEFIRRIELPEMERVSKEGGFSIVPVFKLSVAETDSALRGVTTTPISTFNGVVVEGADRGKIVEAGYRSAALILRSVTHSEPHRVTIALSSKQKVGRDVDLDIDVICSFEGALPTPEWYMKFMRALIAIRQELVRSIVDRIQLHAYAHLSLGVLFGYIFRDRTGFQLEIAQISRWGDRALWSSTDRPEDHGMQFADRPGAVSASDIAVNLKLIARDDSSVPKYCERAGLDLRAILEVSPPGYPYVISSGQAVQLARDIAARIQEMHGKYGSTTVHLFVAVPFALAVILGQHLNACGTIQCYEFDNGERSYYRSCLLQ